MANSFNPFQFLSFARFLFIALAIATVFPVIAHGQWTMGAENIAMGQAYTASSDDRWALFHNPANMSHKQAYIGLFAIRYYGLKELEDHAAVFSFPLSRIQALSSLPVAFSAGFHTYGFELYRESHFRTGFSIGFHGFKWGVTMRLAHVTISGHPSHSALLFDSGLKLPLSSDFSAGVRIINLFQEETGGLFGFRSDSDKPPEPLLFPREIAFGLSWRIVAYSELRIDAVKDTHFPVAVRAGFETQWPGIIFVRLGWTSNPFTWSGGIGLTISNIMVDMAIQHHEILGISPGITCVIKL